MFDDVVFAASDTWLLKQKKDGRWFEQMQPTPAISYRKEYRPTFYQQPRAHTCKRGGLALFEWSRHFEILLHALRFRGEYDKQFCNSYIMRFRYCIDRQSILWFILDYVPSLSRDLKLLSEIVCLRHILIHLIVKWVDCAGRSGGLIHMMTFFVLVSLLYVLACIRNISWRLESNIQAGREECDAATLQCHLHAHPLAVNSSDKDRLCSHTGFSQPLHGYRAAGVKSV